MSRLLTPEDLISIRLAGEVEAHPDGRVFFTGSRADRDTNEKRSRIMVLPPGGEPEPFSEGPFDLAPALSPDGAHLAFLRRRQDQVQLWVMSTSGGEARQLTHVSEGAGDFAWAPDGRSLAFLTGVRGGVLRTEEEAKDEAPRAKFTKDVHVFSRRMYRLDGEGYLDLPVEVARVDLTGSVTLLTHTGGFVQQVVWVGDGSRLALAVHLSDDIQVDRGEIWEVDAAGGDVRPVLVDPDLSADGLVQAPALDGVLAFVTDWNLLGYGDVRLAHLRPGEAPLILGSDLGRTLGNGAATDLVPRGGPPARLEAGGRAVVSMAARDGTTQLARIPLDGSPATWLTTGDHVISSFALTADGPVVALATGAVISDLFRWDEGGLQRLTRLNDALEDEVELATVHRFTARADGGPEVDAWILMPPASALVDAGRIPAVLEIHGGPMGYYPRSVFLEHQIIAAQGIAVIASNPRGSTGYGEAFCDAIRPEWGNADYADLMAVTDAALALEPRLDVARLGVAGGSYGGYMTNWIVGHTDRFAAAHTMRSVVDWRTMSGTSDVYWYWPTRAGGVLPWEDDTFARQQSPITYVRAMKTPLLIEHQERDFRCPVDQDEILYAALKMLGQTEVVYVLYPDEFHGMSRNGKPWHRVHRLELIIAWWRTKLLGEAPAGVLAGHLGKD